MDTNSVRAMRALLVVCAVSTVALAQASAGVSDERINLPEAPGSIDGVGENATAEGNQGALRYRVAVDVPPGFAGVTPAVDFTYSSASGSDVLGIGWSMPSYSIERMTSKGLQQYATDDRFVVEGSEELVRVAESGADATYRSRFEGGFVRYTWKARGTGEGGYWTAEFPDGRVGYYGATAAGVDVPTARVQAPSSAKTFRWHLVAVVDRFGHALNASWTKDPGGSSLLERLDYLYEGATARHSVRFTWEDRTDLLSDGRPGFDLRLTRRLKDVRIFSGTELIRSYVVSYEAMADSGGASRVKAIARLGRGNLAYPVTFTFEYSKTLGGACGAGCEKPFVKQMGAINAGFGTGRATLLDINGDALPDVLSTDPNTGAHTFYYAKLDGEGQVSFDTTGRASAITATAFKLGQPSVQLLDLNGDGFMDLTEARTDEVLCNDGSGDWAASTFCKGTGTGVDASYTLADDPGDTGQDPFHIRFFDFDNDKRIDWLRTDSASSTTVLQNTATGIVPQTVQAIGYVFDESSLQLADMNGDGLQDPVLFNTTANPVNVTYRLNYGRGQWGPEVNVPLTGLTASQATKAELQDLNGDSLADVVAVVGNEVFLAINRNGASFDALRTIRTADLAAGAIPDTSASGTVVSYADMNGNGSDDIVFIQSGGISYLELFPVRPNLLARIDNGIGAVQLVKYGTSIVEQARDVAAGKPWSNKVPNPMTVVTRVENFVTLTGSDSGGLKEISAFRYHSGFYDGVEKQFRGYEGVERELLADMSRDAQEPGLVVQGYDVGKTNPLFAGRQLTQQTFGGNPLVLLREERSTFEACPVAQVPAGTVPAIAFACERVATAISVERDLANAVTLRVERDFDGYGNVVKERNLGVVNRGTPENPTACADCVASGAFGDACGATCLGDERHSEFAFVEPGTATGGLWMTGLVTSEASGAVAGTMMTELRSYYDGPDFQGLALGQATKGAVTRVERRTGAGATDFVTVDRYRRDTHGNVLEHVSANGSVGDATKHRRVYTYEPAGLHVASVELRVPGTGHSGIRRDVVFEPAFEKMSQASNWYPVMGATPLATAQLTRYRYDDHGRLLRVLEAGDTDAAPSQELQYTLADPSSRIVISQRSAASGVPDVVTARCFDGKGRLVQRRSKLSDTSWQVDGFVEFDAAGAVVRRYQPYLATSGACETMPPSGVAFTRYTFDVLGRQLSEVEPDGAVRRTEYRPLLTRFFDEDDTDAAGPHANTPTVETSDGQGRLTSLSRALQSGAGAAAVTRLTYDAMGQLATVRDPADHVRTQVYDRLGNVTSLADTNFGTVTLEYDAEGNEVKRTDAAGVVRRQEYDGAGRLVSRYDEARRAQSERTWTYDRLEGCAECTNTGGNLARVTWPGGAATGDDVFGYDAEGNQVFTRRTLGGRPFTIRRQFDGLDREVKTTYPGGLGLDRTWDGAGRLTAIAGAITAVEYDARGGLGTVRFANGTSTEYAYDGRRRLSGLTTKGADGAALLQLGYTRTPAGDLQAITDGALAGRVRHDAALTADAWGRVTKAELSGAAGVETLGFTYDAIDNVLSATSSLGATSRAHVGAYTYDATRANAVTAAGSLSLTYDQAGRVATRGGVTYGRDFEGRLVSASGGAVDGEFTWDEAERVARVEGDSTTWYIDEDFEVRDGIATLYARLGEDRVTRLESDALAAFVLSDLAPATGTGPVTAVGDGVIDIADAWLAQAQATGVLQVTSASAASAPGALLRSAARRLLVSDATWLHGDHLNSLVLATDTAGAVRGEQSFYPLGEVRESQGWVDEHGFTGQERDESTGLLHFRYRDLDTRTGRWDMPDPAFEELSPGQVRHLGQATVGYAYVGNAFFDAYDPTGLLGGATNAKGLGTGAAGQGAKQATAKPGAAKKGTGKMEKAARIIQVVLAVASAAISIAAAVTSSQSTTFNDANGQMGANLAIAGSSVGAAGTLFSAGLDIKSTFGKKSESDKDASATTPPAPQAQTPPTPPTSTTTATTPSPQPSGQAQGQFKGATPTGSAQNLVRQGAFRIGNRPPNKPPPPVPTAPQKPSGTMSPSSSK